MKEKYNLIKEEIEKSKDPENYSKKIHMQWYKQYIQNIHFYGNSNELYMKKAINEIKERDEFFSSFLNTEKKQTNVSKGVFFHYLISLKLPPQITTELFDYFTEKEKYIVFSLDNKGSTPIETILTNSNLVALKKFVEFIEKERNIKDILNDELRKNNLKQKIIEKTIETILNKKLNVEEKIEYLKNIEQLGVNPLKEAKSRIVFDLFLNHMNEFDKKNDNIIQYSEFLLEKFNINIKDDTTGNTVLHEIFFTGFAKERTFEEYLKICDFSEFLLDNTKIKVFDEKNRINNSPINFLAKSYNSGLANKNKLTQSQKSVILGRITEIITKMILKGVDLYSYNGETDSKRPIDFEIIEQVKQNIDLKKKIIYNEKNKKTTSRF